MTASGAGDDQSGHRSREPGVWNPGDHRTGETGRKWGSKLVSTSGILPNFLCFKVISSFSSSSYMAPSSFPSAVKDRLEIFHLTSFSCFSRSFTSFSCSSFNCFFLARCLALPPRHCVVCRDSHVSIEFHDTLLSDSLLHLLHLLALFVWLLPQVHGTHCLPNIGVKLFRIF